MIGLILNGQEIGLHKPDLLEDGKPGEHKSQIERFNELIGSNDGTGRLAGDDQ